MSGLVERIHDRRPNNHRIWSALADIRNDVRMPCPTSFLFSNAFIPSYTGALHSYMSKHSPTSPTNESLSLDHQSYKQPNKQPPLPPVPAPNSSSRHLHPLPSGSSLLLSLSHLNLDYPHRLEVNSKISSTRSTFPIRHVTSGQAFSISSGEELRVRRMRCVDVGRGLGRFSDESGLALALTGDLEEKRWWRKKL